MAVSTCFLMFAAVLGLSCISLLTCCDDIDLFDPTSFPRPTAFPPSTSFPSTSPKSATMTTEASKRRTVDTTTPPRKLYLSDVLPGNITVPEFGDYVLECRAGGIPLPIITWLRDGRKIEQGEHPIASTKMDDADSMTYSRSAVRSRLFLDCMLPRDNGVYTCVASTPYQRLTTDTIINVIPEKYVVTQTPLSQACMIRASNRKFDFRGAKWPMVPRIYLHTTHFIQFIGKDVLLLCRSLASSPVVTKWSKNHEEMIPSNARTTIMKTGDLLIRDLKWPDVGLYKCEVTSDYGKDVVTSFLYPMASLPLPDERIWQP